MEHFQQRLSPPLSFSSYPGKSLEISNNRELSIDDQYNWKRYIRSLLRAQCTPTRPRPVIGSPYHWSPLLERAVPRNATAISFPRKTAAKNGRRSVRLCSKKIENIWEFFYFVEYFLFFFFLTWMIFTWDWSIYISKWNNGNK